MPGHPNATATAIGGAISIVLLLLMEWAGVDIPAEKREEFGAAITTLIAFSILFVGRGRSSS